MTRPPSAPDLAQLVPNQPQMRTAGEARTDRERSMSKPIGIDLSREKAALSDSLANGVRGRVTGDSTSLYATHSQTQACPDANDSPLRDVQSTVDSTSSNTSVDSSVFSARRTATNSSRLPTTSVTPHNTAKDSPMSLNPSVHPIHNLPSSTTKSDCVARPTSHTTLASSQNGSVSGLDFTIERVPAREPGPSVKGVKYQTDPNHDRPNNKGSSKPTKPTYIQFGLVCITIMLGFCRGGGVSSSVVNLWLMRGTD
jgi:histone-lysine N-methyltransferase SETD1